MREYKLFILQNDFETESFWYFLVLRCQPCICDRCSTEMMLCSLCITLGDSVYPSRINGVNLDHLFKLFSLRYGSFIISKYFVVCYSGAITIMCFFLNLHSNLNICSRPWLESLAPNDETNLCCSIFPNSSLLISGILEKKVFLVSFLYLYNYGLLLGSYFIWWIVIYIIYSDTHCAIFDQ